MKYLHAWNMPKQKENTLEIYSKTTSVVWSTNFGAKFILPWSQKPKKAVTHQQTLILKKERGMNICLKDDAGKNMKRRRADSTNCSIGFPSFTERDKYVKINLLKLQKKKTKGRQ